MPQVRLCNVAPCSIDCEVTASRRRTPRPFLPVAGADRRGCVAPQGTEASRGAAGAGGSAAATAQRGVRCARRGVRPPLGRRVGAVDRLLRQVRRRRARPQPPRQGPRPPPPSPLPFPISRAAAQPRSPFRARKQSHAHIGIPTLGVDVAGKRRVRQRRCRQRMAGAAARRSSSSRRARQWHATVGSSPPQTRPADARVRVCSCFGPMGPSRLAHTYGSCVVASWAPWDACSKTCGGGTSCHPLALMLTVSAVTPSPFCVRRCQPHRTLLPFHRRGVGCCTA